MSKFDQDSFAPLLGRILLATIFLAAGLSKITAFEGTVGYIGSQGVPFPTLAALGTILLEIGGGLILVLGWHARWAAAALGLFTLITAVLFHNFWAVAPDQFQNQLIHFQKNLAIAGGMLYVVLFGSGAYSLRRDD